MPADVVAPPPDGGQEGEGDEPGGREKPKSADDRASPRGAGDRAE